MTLVAIVLGSKSDAAIMEECARTLDRLGIAHETELISAHRSPERARHGNDSTSDSAFRPSNPR